MIQEEDKLFATTFLESAMHVLSTMAFVHPECKNDPVLKKDNITTGDVTGIVSLTGDKKITVMLSFSEKCILHIISSMFGEEMTEVNEEVRDAVGEFTNMISGDTRRRLADNNNIMLDGGVPSVIVAHNHKIESITKFPLVSITILINNEPLTLDLAIDK